MTKITKYLTSAYRKAQVAIAAVLAVAVTLNLDDGISRGEWIALGIALSGALGVGAARNTPTDRGTSTI